MIAVEWVGLVPYLEMLERQRARREAVIEGREPEVLWLVEHPPVVTLGRRGGAADLASAAGVEVVATERGGLATWHGPGQLVGYPIVDAGRRGWAVKGVVAGIEEGLISWLAGRGVAAGRREGWPGVWVGTDKIAALGLHFRRGVSLHGFALNLDLGPEAFRGIVPCGVSDGGVTCLRELTGVTLRPAEVAEEVGRAVLDAIRAGAA